ncbi:hypothetical protein ACSNOJ_29375 [Streptomyces sp. URMC 128]|uniref:hypothetical protein n=1 Tax=Streptomyces sp. URMC 128 TaxID=3423404 RepID=UPI003F1DFA95
MAALPRQWTIREPPEGVPLRRGGTGGARRAPRTEGRAGQLAELLSERARQDPDFAAALEMWRRRADAEAGSRAGDVHTRSPAGPRAR